MSTQKQDQHWNAAATEIHQLNPGGPDQRQSIEPQGFFFFGGGGAFMKS